MSNIQATRLFKDNLEATKPIVLNVGGARSSKSYSIMQLLLYKCLKEKDIRILICRKTLPSLRLSTISPLLDMVYQYGYQSVSKYFKQENTLLIYGNKITFKSIDNIEKIKSTEFNYIFIEECNEFDYNTFQILKMRLSRKNKNGENRIYMAMNPVSCWVWDKLVYDANMKNEVQIIKSNYKDNPFLPQDYIDMLENLKYQNEYLYKIYTLGEYAELSESIVFNNWQVIDIINWRSMEDIIYGLDFGYQNPTALVKVGIKENNIYLEEKIYKNKITNQDLIWELEKLERYDIYADSAEPNRIEEIYRAGFNIYPALKDVKYGIDLIKSKQLYIHSNSINLINEIKTYSYKIDKNGKILEEPVKYNDHLIDALRYAVASRCQKGEVKIWVL